LVKESVVKGMPVFVATQLRLAAPQENNLANKKTLIAENEDCPT
jgi:hypothetical protein